MCTEMSILLLIRATLQQCNIVESAWQQPSRILNQEHVLPTI